jgi:hypothetical protein
MATATATVAMAVRKGTAVRPWPGSRAKRIPTTVGTGSPRPASREATLGLQSRAPVPPAPPVAFFLARRYAVLSAEQGPI